MTLKEQFAKIKENWMLILIVLVILAALQIGNISPLTGSFSPMGYSEDKMMAAQSQPGMGYIALPPSYGDFAPGVQERKITKTSSISTEVKSGSFNEAESRLKSIIKSSDSYLLNENVNKYDSGWKSYKIGSYQIKVDTKKYDAVTAQLKEIGEVKSFSENAEDVTGSYKDIEIELNAEKQRLLRYNKMYDEAILTADKIQISDKIFNEERTIKYLEDSLENIGQRVDYATIYLTLSEKQPEYSGIVFVKFSELVRTLVSSINSLFMLLFAVLPYAVAAFIVWIIVRFFRNRG